jgi:hypothetical protein
MTDEELDKLSDLVSHYACIGGELTWQALVDFVNAMLAKREGE